MGTGEGAEGTISTFDAQAGEPNAKLSIVSPGVGFSSEPRVMILDEYNQTLLSLDPSWIKQQNGYQPSYETVGLRDFETGSNRGIRGLHLFASPFSPKGLDYEDENLNAFWLSYRQGASEYGLTILNGHTRFPFAQENFLLDMNLNTPGDFSDAHLLLGHTFSDYDSDIHITPFRKGGTAPMEYLEVVVNIGTVEDGLSSAPLFFG